MTITKDHPIWYLRDVKSHKLLSITGLETEQLDLTEGTVWATSWSDRQEAENQASRIMNDFSPPLAGVTLEVVHHLYA
jgi:hypothetical protein